MNKTTLIATALVTVFSASSAFAWWGEGDKGHNNNNCGGENRSSHYEKGKHGKRGMKGMHVKEQMDRSYSADEIRTLNEARLIMQGNPNVKVGNVTSTKDGYKVTIVTKDDSLVKEVELAKNGMQLERYNLIKERIEAKERK